MEGARRPKRQARGEPARVGTGAWRPRRVPHAESSGSRRPLPRVLQGGTGRDSPQLPLHGPGNRPCAAGQQGPRVARARGARAGSRRQRSRRALAVGANQLRGGGRTRSDVRGSRRGRRASSTARASFVVGSCRHLFHVGQLRTPERGDAHTRDARLDAGRGGGRARADARRSSPRRFFTFPPRGVLYLLQRAQRRRRRRRGADVRRRRAAASTSRRPPDRAVDASLRALRADPGSRCLSGGLRLAAALPRGGGHRVRRARAGVHEAERFRDRRGLWHDRGRACDVEPT